MNEQTFCIIGMAELYATQQYLLWLPIDFVCKSQAHCWQMFNLLKIISVSMRTAIAYVRLQSQNHRPKKEANKKHESKCTKFLCCCKWLIVRQFAVCVFFSPSCSFSFRLYFDFYVHFFAVNTNARRVTNYMQIQPRLLNVKLHELRRCQILMPFFSAI